MRQRNIEIRKTTAM